MRPTSQYATSDDTPLAELASRQHGFVATWQLLPLGYSHAMILTRVKARRIHRYHPGVYAVGHKKVTIKGRWMAAVLACGPDAVLSHRAAAALHDLQRAPATIDVTAPRKRVVKGVRCHVSRTLRPQDRTMRDGIPVTSVERTILDLADRDSQQRLRSLLEALQRRDLFDSPKFDSLLARTTGRRGSTRLRRALNELTAEPPWTQSHPEQLLLERVRAAGLTEPRTNVFVDGILVDFYWPEHKLVVEVDGFEFHKSRRSFEDDRRKDAKHAIAGRRAVRFTPARIHSEPRAVERELRALLGE